MFFCANIWQQCYRFFKEPPVMKTLRLLLAGSAFYLIFFFTAILIHVIIHWPPAPDVFAQDANDPLKTTNPVERFRPFTIPSNYDVMMEKELAELRKVAEQTQSQLELHLRDQKQELEIAVIKTEMMNMRKQLDDSVKIQWGIGAMFLTQIISYFFGKLRAVRYENGDQAKRKRSVSE
jgi:hypothetical protein